MARVFITGSADGLGQLAAKALVHDGHRVVVHGRNDERANDALQKVSGAEEVVTGDLSNIDATKELAAKVNALGRFDAVIHNAGVYKTSAKEIFMVNTLAPYILTCLIERSERLVYISSGMHLGGRAKLDDLNTDVNSITYSDSKLHVLMLCKVVARTWPDVYANAVDPGWVPTKMGGKDAPDDLQKGYETQVWLAVSEDLKAKVSGRYFHHKKDTPCSPEADDLDLQDKFVSVCEEITGVRLP